MTPEAVDNARDLLLDGRRGTADDTVRAIGVAVAHLKNGNFPLVSHGDATVRMLERQHVQARVVLIFLLMYKLLLSSNVPNAQNKATEAILPHMSAMLSTEDYNTLGVDSAGACDRTLRRWIHALAENEFKCFAWDTRGRNPCSARDSPMRVPEHRDAFKTKMLQLAAAKDKATFLSPRAMSDWWNTDYMAGSIGLSLSLMTEAVARYWMVKLGARLISHRPGVYQWAHDREDVKARRVKYCRDLNEALNCSAAFVVAHVQTDERLDERPLEKLSETASPDSEYVSDSESEQQNDLMESLLSSSTSVLPADSHAMSSLPTNFDWRNLYTDFRAQEVLEVLTHADTNESAPPDTWSDTCGYEKCCIDDGDCLLCYNCNQVFHNDASCLNMGVVQREGPTEAQSDSLSEGGNVAKFIQLLGPRRPLSSLELRTQEFRCTQCLYEAASKYRRMPGLQPIQSAVVTHAQLSTLMEHSHVRLMRIDALSRASLVTLDERAVTFRVSKPQRRLLLFNDEALFYPSENRQSVWAVDNGTQLISKLFDKRKGGVATMVSGFLGTFGFLRMDDDQLQRLQRMREARLGKLDELRNSLRFLDDETLGYMIAALTEHGQSEAVSYRLFEQGHSSLRQKEVRQLNGSAAVENDSEFWNGLCTLSHAIYVRDMVAILYGKELTTTMVFDACAGHHKYADNALKSKALTRFPRALGESAVPMRDGWFVDAGGQLVVQQMHLPATMTVGEARNILAPHLYEKSVSGLRGGARKPAAKSRYAGFAKGTEQLLYERAKAGVLLQHENNNYQDQFSQVTAETTRKDLPNSTIQRDLLAAQADFSSQQTLLVETLNALESFTGLKTEVLALPPYHAELNPIELAWNLAKKWLRNPRVSSAGRQKPATGRPAFHAALHEALGPRVIGPSTISKHWRRMMELVEYYISHPASTYVEATNGITTAKSSRIAPDCIFQPRSHFGGAAPTPPRHQVASSERYRILFTDAEAASFLAGELPAGAQPAAQGPELPDEDDDVNSRPTQRRRLSADEGVISRRRFRTDPPRPPPVPPGGPGGPGLAEDVPMEEAETEDVPMEEAGAYCDSIGGRLRRSRGRRKGL